MCSNFIAINKVLESKKNERENLRFVYNLSVIFHYKSLKDIWKWKILRNLLLMKNFENRWIVHGPLAVIFGIIAIDVQCVAPPPSRLQTTLLVKTIAEFTIYF